MKTYKHLFFDLDHTLWDFDRNSHETLLELYDGFSLGTQGIESRSAFIEAFRKINFQLWDEYNRALVTKKELREKRFEQVLSLFKVANTGLSKSLAEAYLAQCPRKPNLIEHCIEILEYLAPKYTLHIITNGFKDVQSLKLASGGIARYFQTVVTSECVGAKKPNIEIFAHALAQSNANAHEALMIGDNLQTDIRGALNAAWDCVYLNSNLLPHDEPVTYEIRELRKLKTFL